MSLIAGKWQVDYTKLPYPIDKYQNIIPEVYRRQFKWLNLKATDDDKHTADVYFATTRATKAKGKRAIRGLRSESIIYCLKYLRTVDNAVGEAGNTHWAMIKDTDGKLHYPLVCNQHLMSIHWSVTTPSNKT